MAAASDERADARSGSSRAWVESLWAAVAALLGLGAAAPSLGLLQWDPSTPFALGQDDVQLSMQLKTIHEYGWYWTNPDLGFPDGLNGSWFPELNVLHVALVKLLDLVVGNGYTAGGIYFVAAFPLTAAAGYLLVRSQGLSRISGVAAGVLLANAPGHAGRYGHLYLAQYWVVAVAMWLVLEVARGRPLWHGNVLGRIPRRAVTVVAVLVVGLSGAYYVGFTLLLLVVAAVGRRVTGRPVDLLRGLAVAVGLGIVIAGPLALAKIGTSGDLVTGRLPATRLPAESETYAGKLMDLVLPWPEHRVAPLRLLSQAYNGTTTATVEVSALGIVGVVGLVALSAAGLGALLSGRQTHPDVGRWSGLALVSFLLYTVGGLGSFVAFFGTPQLRTWSRMSLYIMVLCLLAVSLLLTRLERRRGTVVAAVVAVVVGLVGVADQTNPAAAPNHAATTAEMARLQTYVSTLQEATGGDCGVFQLPVVAYPESGPYLGMDDYDQLRPYLADSTMRFSAGAMRGTAASTWQRAVDTTDVPELAQRLRAAGFCAVEVDTRGFRTAQDPRSRLEQALGAPVASTSDGELVSYRLPDPTAGTDTDALRTQVLDPVLVSVEGYDITTSNGIAAQRIGPYGGLAVANAGREDRDVSVVLSVRGVGSGTREVVVRDGDTVVARGTVSSSSSADLTVRTTASPGLTTLSIAVSGDAERVDPTEPVASAVVSVRSATGPTGVRVAVEQRQVASGWVVQ